MDQRLNKFLLSELLHQLDTVTHTAAAAVPATADFFGKETKTGHGRRKADRVGFDAGKSAASIPTEANISGQCPSAAFLMRSIRSLIAYGNNQWSRSL